MADWNTSGATSRTRNGGPGRRKHWKLPDMIQGVRHRFRDKRRSKSPDFCLDADSASNTEAYNGMPRMGASLPRAASMLSTDYGFGADAGPTSLTRAVTSGPGGSTVTPYRNNTWDTGGGRVPPITVTRLQQSSSIDPGSFSECDLASSSAQSSRLTSSSSSNRTQPPPALSSVGRAQSVNAVNEAGVSQNGSHGNSIHRAKSVRFGENRISVFLQDSTQALEECVRLALSYAEETKRGDYCSDSEAVSLSRSLQHRDPGAARGAGQFWSDSEDRQRTDRGRHDKTCAKNLSHTRAGYSGDTTSMAGPPTPTNYKPKSFGQAVNSLDRVERLDKSHLDKSRKKRSAQINEIFSFIDKILSGCDSGCNDEFCPLVREAARSGPHAASSYQNSGSESWTKQNKTYRFNSSSVSSEYQSRSKKSCSFPGGHTSDSYAYSQDPAQLTARSLHQNKTSGSNGLRSATPTGEAGGWASDSDCDSSECSTLVRAGQPGHAPRRPPRSRLRTEVSRVGWRTTEDVFAQIIICCESNKESLGMPKYRHIHQKISQTVCNAIFLCKVIQYKV